MGLFDFFKRKKSEEVCDKSIPSEEENPYEHLMWSIHGLKDQFKRNNKLGFVGDQIIIKKMAGHYNVDCNLVMPSHQCMTMSYTLDLSARQFIPQKIDILLETEGEAIIEQNKW